MAFGVYIHIPYCIQRCGYCDFATYQHSQIMPPDDYFTLLHSEISQKSEKLNRPKLTTVYFGGGTPSLVPSDHIVKTISHLKYFFDFSLVEEITLEVNPATLNPEKMAAYLDAGINRFSVGAQTFSNSQLKRLGREHNANQTLETLEFLKARGVNYNFDLLFGLPHQSLQDLEADLKIVERYKPNHISPYCLTLQEGHPLNINRPSDEVQEEMFLVIKERLEGLGYYRYEISNFALPGYESKHNSLYWTGDTYVGFGLSAHSYLPHSGDWGTRFWNPRSITDYASWVQSLSGKVAVNCYDHLPSDHLEHLQKHQALTDHAHTVLRTMAGLDLERLKVRFGERVYSLVKAQLDALLEAGLLKLLCQNTYTLTEKGVLLSNQVFRDLTYLSGELD